jgi:hypothetical protein
VMVETSAHNRSKATTATSSIGQTADARDSSLAGSGRLSGGILMSCGSRLDGAFNFRFLAFADYVIFQFWWVAQAI